MTDERAWVLAERKTDKGLSLVRLKELETSFPFERFPERLSVIWSFSDTGPDDTPSNRESDAMEKFENRICEHIERTQQAVLCEELSEIPQERKRYPIEIHHESDASGKFYESYASKLIRKASQI